VLVVDNTRVREGQIARLKEVRANRDEDACQETLDALTEVALNGGYNLLEAHVAAARARATIGEMTYAVERAFNRYKAPVEVVTGVYRKEFADSLKLDAVAQRNADFAQVTGTKARLYVAKMGQDGHDRGAKVIASAFSDLGFEVVAGQLFQSPDEAAQTAIAEKVHVVGVSTQAGAHATLVPELIRELEKQGGGHILVICGGVIPEQDYAALKDAGVAAIFPPGTPIPDSANKLLELLEERHRKGNFFTG
jgi:methylmalonyl-CoA mutase